MSALTKFLCFLLFVTLAAAAPLQAAAKLHAAATLAAAYGLHGARVEEAVVAGAAAREILRLAAARSAGMLVIGAHGPGTAFRGSLPDKVIRAAHCPVLTVRGPS